MVISLVCGNGSDNIREIDNACFDELFFGEEKMAEKWKIENFR